MLRVVPAVVTVGSLPASGTAVPLAIPASASLCGTHAFLQAVHTDSGASAGLAFTRGLELVVGR